MVPYRNVYETVCCSVFSVSLLINDSKFSDGDCHFLAMRFSCRGTNRLVNCSQHLSMCEMLAQDVL